MSAKWRWARIMPGGYEVSTKGDARFSALNARLSDGRSIEEAYQLDIKGYRAFGSTSWRDGKGKPPLFELTPETLWASYLGLWREWGQRNQRLIAELAEKSGPTKVLTDCFARTPVSQARALAAILNGTDDAERAPEAR